MQDKIIDFNVSKEKLLNKKYPNINIYNKTKKHIFFESNIALDNFQNIFLKYQEYLIDQKNNKEVKIEEVLVYFNRYFDELYKTAINFDDPMVAKLKDGMDYAVLSSGKRIRPFLMFVMYNFFKGTECLILAPYMLAIELIHNFSLIHDDLPSIDNDTLRHGKPTVWKKYGEDVGLLIGDALMMEASTILVEAILELGYTALGTHAIISALVLLKLSGLEGMIAGEVFDVINTNNKKLSLEDLFYMYDKKTTALITASMSIGANMTGRLDDKIEEVEKLSMCIGEAYQIKDDLLEVESTTEKIGKSVDSDKNNNKVTYVSLFGIKNAKKRISDLTYEAYKMVEKMTNQYNKKEAEVLKTVISYLIGREK